MSLFQIHVFAAILPKLASYTLAANDTAKHLVRAVI